MEGENVATKAVLVALVIGIAVWALIGAPAPSSSSVVYVTHRQ